jgi:hypothetical protein
VLIHIGNTVADTRGCLLINSGISIDQYVEKPDFSGTGSTPAYKLFYDLVEKAFERGEEVTIEIFRRQIIDEGIFQF